MDPSWQAFAAACCVGWLVIWYNGKDDKTVHEAHAWIIGVLCCAALQGYTPEIATILASFTYFLCDTLDAVRLGKYGMLVGHHLPALVLFGSQPFYPDMLKMQFASYLLLIEFSTPLLIRWRRSRQKAHFVQFMMSFVVLRVCYLIWLGLKFNREIGSYPALAAWALVIVNLYWFAMQSRLLFDYRDGLGADEKEEKRKST